MESVTVEMPKEPPSQQLPETTDMETTTKEESQRKEIEELRRTIEEKRRLLVSPTYLFYWVWPVTFVGYMFVVSYRKTVALRDTLRYLLPLGWLDGAGSTGWTCRTCSGGSCTRTCRR